MAIFLKNQWLIFIQIDCISLNLIVKKKNILIIEYILNSHKIASNHLFKDTT